MGDSYTNLLYHVVFSTKDRQPLITPDYEERLYDYIGGTIRDLGGISLALNGTVDHLHLLAKLRPDRALSDVLRKLKANASGWMHRVFPGSRILRGREVMGRSRSVNQTYQKLRSTSPVRNSIIRRLLFEMNSFDS